MPGHLTGEIGEDAESGVLGAVRLFNLLHVSEQRLDQAYDALMTTDVPIKLIAVNLGYSHVNHFSNAFRKKFGYPPGSLRR
jgi:AraC-like DNA-binding protein